MKIRATLYDARGVEVETIEGEAEEVAAQAGRFVLIHGADPDEDGREAQPGRIDFQPIRGA